VRLEGLGQLKKIHLIGTGTRDLPACNIVPQPTTLPCSPRKFSCGQKLHFYGKSIIVLLTSIGNFRTGNKFEDVIVLFYKPLSEYQEEPMKVLRYSVPEKRSATNSEVSEINIGRQ
jgi:hypothetical protein